MLRFEPVAPACKLTANQRQIARRILLGFEGEFPRENELDFEPETVPKSVPGITVKTDAISGPEDPLKRSRNMALIVLEKLPVTRVVAFPCAHCLKTVLTVRYGDRTELVFDAYPGAEGDDVVLKAHTCTGDETDGGGL